MYFYRNLFILLLAMAAAVFVVCSDDENDNPVNVPVTPGPPQALFGTPASLGSDTVSMMLLWTAPGGSVSGYNVYRKIGIGDFEKLNDSLITRVSFGPEPGIRRRFILSIPATTAVPPINIIIM